MDRRCLFLMALLFCIVSGCAQSDENLIRNTVKNYNKNLIIVLKSPDMETLKEVATEREQGRIEIFKTQMADEHKIVDAKLNNLKFKSVKKLTEKEWQDLIARFGQEHKMDKRIPDAGSLDMYKSGAIVETEEVWDYQYLDTETRQKTGPLKKLGYNVIYIMVEEQGKWKVGDIKFEEKNVGQ